MSEPKYQLYENIHEQLSNIQEQGVTYLTRQKYDYFHYCCDKDVDVGYGCGYRTIQSICSMLKKKLNSVKKIPSIVEIQEILVRMGDKDETFINSRGWIGTIEGSFIFDELFGIPSFIIHVPYEARISSKKDEIIKYFKEQGGLIFMGGDSDAAAKMITGVHLTESQNLYLQVVDPHFSKIPKNPHEIVQQGFVKWYAEDDFQDQSFYNLCMPKIK